MYIYLDKALPFQHLRIYDGYKPENRTMNLILDLHNYYIRHKGLLVSRNMFFTVLANLFKCKGEDERAAIKWCKKYTDKEYYDEMVQIVLQVYNREEIKRIPNKKIGQFLCFTAEDIAESYCCFSEERKVEAKKARNNNHYEKRRKSAGKLSTEEKQKMHLEYLRLHPDIKDKEAMEALGIGRTTFYDLKKLI